MSQNKGIVTEIPKQNSIRISDVTVWVNRISVQLNDRLFIFSRKEFQTFLIATNRVPKVTNRRVSTYSLSDYYDSPEELIQRDIAAFFKFL